MAAVYCARTLSIPKHGWLDRARSVIESPNFKAVMSAAIWLNLPGKYSPRT